MDSTQLAELIATKLEAKGFTLGQINRAFFEAIAEAVVADIQNSASVAISAGDAGHAPRLWGGLAALSRPQAVGTAQIGSAAGDTSNFGEIRATGTN